MSSRSSTPGALELAGLALVTAVAWTFVESALTYRLGRAPASVVAEIALAATVLGIASWVIACGVRVFHSIPWLPAWTIAIGPCVLLGLRGLTDQGQAGPGSAALRAVTTLLLVGGAALVYRRGVGRLEVALPLLLTGAAGLGQALRALVGRPGDRGSAAPETWAGVGWVGVECAVLAVILSASPPLRNAPQAWIMRAIPIVLAAGLHATIGHRDYVALPPSRAVSSSAAAGPQRGPDVILIVLDTARRDAFSIYGEQNPTPAMARLAERATVYTRAYAASSYSLPTHASLFSGELPSIHGAHGTAQGERSLPVEVETIAEMLSARGYDAIGVSANGAYLAPWTGLQSGFRWFWEGTWFNPAFLPSINGVRVRLGLRRLDDAPASEEIADLIGRALPRLGRPMFLFVNLMDAHGPYRKEIVGGRLDARSRYLGMVAHQDAQVGRVLEQLSRDGRYENALIVVTADHGEYLGEHGFSGHQGGPLFEPLIAIPLVVRWPLQTTSRRSDDLMTQMDVKGMIRSAVTGESWDQPAPGVPRVVAESWWRSGRHTPRRSDGLPETRVVMFGAHKLIEGGRGDDQLFDLRSDPGETRDLMKMEPILARVVRDTMIASVGPMRAGARADRPAATIPPEALERLRALGYVK